LVCIIFQYMNISVLQQGADLRRSLLAGTQYVTI